MNNEFEVARALVDGRIPNFPAFGFHHSLEQTLEVTRLMLESCKDMSVLVGRGCTSHLHAPEQIDYLLQHARMDVVLAALRDQDDDWWKPLGITVERLSNEVIRNVLRFDDSWILVPGKGFLRNITRKAIQARANEYWSWKVYGFLKRKKVDLPRAWEELNKAARGYIHPDFEKTFKGEPKSLDYIKAPRYWKASSRAVEIMLKTFLDVLADKDIQLGEETAVNWVSRALYENADSRSKALRVGALYPKKKKKS